MGGGDDSAGPSWDILTQPASMDSHSFGVSQAKLQELELLVRYEFPGQPFPPQELVYAMRMHASNTAQAIQYLKERRRLSRISIQPGISASQPLPESTSKRPGDDMMHDAPKRPRSLCLQSSQENSELANGNAMSYSQPTQQTATQYSSATSQDTTMSDAPAVHVELSQRHLGVSSSSEQTPQQSLLKQILQSSVVRVDSIAVRDLIERTVEDRRSLVKRDPNWMDDVWRHLQVVPASLELSYHLDNSCSALANWLNQLKGEDVGIQNRNSIDMIMDALAMLPNVHESAQDVVSEPCHCMKLKPSDRTNQFCMCMQVKRCVPSNDVVDDLDNQVVEMVDLATNSASSSAHARSVASKQAIDSIIQASAAYMERIVWFKGAVAETRALDRAIRAQLQSLSDRFLERVVECQGEVESGDSLVEKAKQVKDTRTQQIREIVYKRREQLIQEGEIEASAELQAYTEVVNSMDDEVVALRQARVDCDEKILRCQANMVNEKSALSFYESMVGLLKSVRQQRERALEVS